MPTSMVAAFDHDPIIKTPHTRYGDEHSDTPTPTGARTPGGPSHG